MDNIIKITCYQIYFQPKDFYDPTSISDIYDICHIDYLTKVIKQKGIENIKYIKFYITVNGYNIAFMYNTISVNSKYIFAPCYNIMTPDYILQTYKSHIINTLMNTIINYSADIKEIFIDRIDESKEIIYDFNHED